MSSELNDYNTWTEAREREWEALCLNCGACCGASEDPCEHLKRDASGKYFCDTYPNRLGAQRTVSGDAMVCVPIRRKLQGSWPGDEGCGYKEKGTA